MHDEVGFVSPFAPIAQAREDKSMMIMFEKARSMLPYIMMHIPDADSKGSVTPSGCEFESVKTEP